MHDFLVILLALCSLLGFAFLFAGCMSLVFPDQKDMESVRERDKAARENGRIAEWLEVGEIYREYSNPFRRAGVNWRKRPQACNLLYAGVIFLVIAASIGYRLGVFP